MGSQCAICSRSKESPAEKLCSQCKESEMQIFQAVRDYLSKHPFSNAMQIANETGIPISKITKFIKQGSFTIYH